MTHRRKHFFATLSGPQLGFFIAITFFAILIAMQLLVQMRSVNHVPTDEERLLALAKAHPDTRIRKVLAEAVRSDEIVLRTEDLGSRANGTFSVPGKQPTITLDSTLLTASATRAGQEIAFAVLSHEYEHYLQWLRMPAVRELHETYRTDTRLSPAQCVLKVATEDEAYALTCYAAYRYGWKAAIRTQCDGIGLGSRAERFMAKVSDLPECKDTWESLIQKEIPPPVPVTSTKPSLPEESDSGGEQ
ncbi:MAG: hypothetical protein WC866_05050 [Patescibacteria group bacterium]